MSASDELSGRIAPAIHATPALREAMTPDADGGLHIQP
jgi:hypothetical protein